jgi:ferredoxin
MCPVPSVVFESLSEPPVEVVAPNGGRLIDVCDEEHAPVPFSCRSASCGTCRIVVVEGEALLDKPLAEELEVLLAFGDDLRTHRLACQARLAPGPGRVRVRRAV